MVNAGFPGDNGICTRVYRRYGCRKRDSVPHFDFSLYGVDVDATATKEMGHDRVFRTADHRSPECNNLMNEIGSLTGSFPRKVASQTPANDPDFLPILARQRKEPLEDARQELRYISRIRSASQAAHPVTEKS